MAEVTAIRPADLRAIENNLRTIHRELEALDSGLGVVNSNVQTIHKEVSALAADFYNFVDVQMRANRRGIAETRLVKIRQELKDKFGNYDVVRKTTTGILQANDLGIVKRDTISHVTEEQMITTPNYWLAPCLVALSAWISDQRELAERALRESINRDDEKTSLFFALVCRRAGRKQASLKWTQRYLANQNEEDLDRKTIIILDAYASGLLGADTEGVISRQIGEWMEKLTEKPGFVEQQTAQWSEAINMKREKLAGNTYPYLRKYSKTWPDLEYVMEGAYLHARILNYFTDIFSQNIAAETLEAQLDDILNSLVTNFDDEELPLRREEKFEQFILDFDGDENQAKQKMDVEKTAFETHKDFTQLLTDAAMKPESSGASVSTQKFSIALSKDWIKDAYNDAAAQNRMKIPDKIAIQVDTFKAVTRDGENEQELLENFYTQTNYEEECALSEIQLSGFTMFCLFGGAIIAGLGIGAMIAVSVMLGVIALVAGVAMVMNYFSKKNQMNQARMDLAEQFQKKREQGSKIIRAVLAEVVDFRREFAVKDAESQKVLDFLEQISPDQYVKRLADANRRVRL